MLQTLVAVGLGGALLGGFLYAHFTRPRNVHSREESATVALYHDYLTGRIDAQEWGRRMAALRRREEK